MITPTLSVLAVLLAAAAPAPAPDAMAPFVSIGRHLERAGVALLAGESPGDAVKPWAFDDDPTALSDVRASLTAAGVATLEFGGFEFEPTLAGPNGVLGALRTVILVPGGIPGVVHFELREVQEERGPRGTRIEEWNGAHGDFGEAARRFLALVASDRCPQIPIAEMSIWKGTPMEEKATRDLEELRGSIPATCASLAPARRVTHLRVDDFGYVGHDAAGTPVGVLGGELELRDGVLTVSLGDRFEPFPTKVDPPLEDGPALRKPDRSSPSATWETLRSAVAARDLDAYGACFVPESRDREGAVDKLRENPALWDELAGVLRGPQTFDVSSLSGDTARCRVEAPEADGGGIGGLTMQKIGDEWLIRSW